MDREMVIVGKMRKIIKWFKLNEENDDKIDETCSV